MGLVEQLMELGKEQIPAVTGMVRLTSLNQFCPQSFFTDLRHSLLQLRNGKGCVAIYVHSNLQSHHFFQRGDRPVHLKLRDCKPDDGNNDEGFQSSSVRLFPA